MTAIAERYVGEDIQFTIKKRKADLSYYNLDDDFVDIFVYVSNKAQTIKFSKNAKAGYTQLIRNSSTEYICELSSAQSALISFSTVQISFDFVALNAVIDDGRENKKSGSIAVKLKPIPTQDER
jgi:hypothetical protein